jgi:outer membrane protein
MKKTIAIIITAVFAFFGTAKAQQKIGHINSVDIYQAMPEVKQMNGELQKAQESYEKAGEAMMADYEKKQKELQELSNNKSTPDAILESHIQDLQDLQKRIEDFKTKVQEDLQKLQQEKSKPIQDKYLKAVKEVAVANGYSYILDTNTGIVAYYPESADDVTDLVLKKLNITRAPAGTGTGTSGMKPGPGNK